MNTNPNQSKRIIAYIRACGNITALDALNAIGCLNLKARVHELRNAGWGIETTFIATPSGKRVARYSLTDPAQATATGIPQPGRKAKLPTSAIIAQVERELEHARAGVDWKDGARWALEQVKKRQ